MTELDAGRTGVRYGTMETTSHVVLDISSGFATHLASTAVGILLKRLKKRVSYLVIYCHLETVLRVSDCSFAAAVRAWTLVNVFCPTKQFKDPVRTAQ